MLKLILSLFKSKEDLELEADAKKIHDTLNAIGLSSRTREGAGLRKMSAFEILGEQFPNFRDYADYAREHHTGVKTERMLPPAKKKSIEQ